MKKYSVILMLFLLILPMTLFAANQGKITRLDFSSAQSTWGAPHSDIVQVLIEGGYDAPNCNSEMAAIKKSDQHLVSAVLSAYMAGKIISVNLDSSSTYWDGSRCIIKDLSVFP